MTEMLCHQCSWAHKPEPALDRHGSAETCPTCLETWGVCMILPTCLSEISPNPMAECIEVIADRKNSGWADCVSVVHQSPLPICRNHAL